MALFSNLKNYTDVIRKIEDEYFDFESHMYSGVEFDNYGSICIKMKGDKTVIKISINNNNSSVGYFELENPYLFSYIINRKYFNCHKIVNPCINRTFWKEYTPKLHSMLGQFDNYEEAISSLFVSNLMNNLEKEYGKESWFDKLKQEYIIYKFNNA